MTWILAALGAWAVLAVAVALLLGRGIRLADAVEEHDSWTDEVERYLRDQAPAPRA